MGGAIKIFGKNEKFEVSQCRKKGESLIVSTKVEKGTLLLWNGFLSHVRGLGCVENEVLSTYGKSTKMHIMHKKWTDRVELTKKN